MYATAVLKDDIIEEMSAVENEPVSSSTTPGVKVPGDEPFINLKPDDPVYEQSATSGFIPKYYTRFNRQSSTIAPLFTVTKEPWKILTGQGTTGSKRTMKKSPSTSEQSRPPRPAARAAGSLTASSTSILLLSLIIYIFAEQIKY